MRKQIRIGRTYEEVKEECSELYKKVIQLKREIEYWKKEAKNKI